VPLMYRQSIGMQDSVMRQLGTKSSGLRTASIINMQAPREEERENYGRNEVVERRAPASGFV
jgi:hypothetical protein